MDNYDAIIIGGSYAGLSAAMALGRSLRKTLVIDAGEPCNRQTPHSQNFLTQDGKTPLEISSIAKEQVMKYDSVKFVQDRVIDGQETGDGFAVITASGKNYVSKKLIFATGIVDRIPAIPGFAECWGISVIHCPYCHGYEYRGQKTAIYAPAPKAIHLAPLIQNLTDQVSIIAADIAEFTPEQLEKLQANNIPIIEREIASIVHYKGYLSEIRFIDGLAENFDALYAGIPFKQAMDLPEKLGCSINKNGLIEVDFMQKTGVPGLYACGDNSSMMRSVATAVFTGNVVGAMVNMDLAHEGF